MPNTNYDSQGRGEWVVGLNPDDRMPNDWLRMVARVFAAYRKKPLRDSIVVYIDGLNVSLQSYLLEQAIFDITPGQAFVDDQFIGFIEDSIFEINTTNLIPEVTYCLVLQYRWINQFPPPQPSFQFHRDINVNEEEMLCLAKVILHDDGTTRTLEVIDDKVPWYREMVDASTGNTEVDNESQLPYIIAIKGPEDGEFPEDGIGANETGSLDIGWALDFHHEVGNGVNFNARLHTDKVNDGLLFLNGKELITTMDPNDPNNPNDPSDPGDSFIGISNNITISDVINLEVGGIDNPSSDSGFSCYSMKTSLLADPSSGDPDEHIGAKVGLDHASKALVLENRSDYFDSSSQINTLALTEEVDTITLNGHLLWHEGNMSSTGQNIMFVGYFAGSPSERPNGDPLEDGDQYYDTSVHAYFYYQVDSWIQIGRSDAMKQYEFEATEGQQTVTLEYNPQFVWVGVSGVNLSKSDYVATDGQTIFFNKALNESVVITVFTVLSGEASGVRVLDLSDVQIVGLNHNDTLRWDSTILKWVNGAVNVTSLDDIGDVQVGAPQDGQYLQWNAASAAWLATSQVQTRLLDLADVEINNPVSGETLVYNGQSWVNEGMVPPGTIITWAANSAPTGYIECNGATLSRITYANLFANIGTAFGPGNGSSTFKIPDLRGEFIRGWDHNRGLDTGRIFGTLQNGAIQAHTHTVDLGEGGGWSSPSGGVAQRSWYSTPEVTDTSGSTGGSETRPRNIAMMYCIKY